MDKVKFTKLVGGWGFEIEGHAFAAIRNVAGFAHRDWDLYVPERGMRAGRIVADQLGSRGECVGAAKALVARDAR